MNRHQVHENARCICGCVAVHAVDLPGGIWIVEYTCGHTSQFVNHQTPVLFRNGRAEE